MMGMKTNYPDDQHFIIHHYKCQTIFFDLYGRMDGALFFN